MSDSGFQENKRHGKGGNNAKTKRAKELHHEIHGKDSTYKKGEMNLGRHAMASKRAFIRAATIEQIGLKSDFNVNKHAHIDTTQLPPITVVVQGPPNSGKSLLIKSLVKSITTQKIENVLGPVTILTPGAKKRRITFIEAPNDLNSMIDLAKICDIALCLVDIEFGFDMSTFEFLNIAQNHGTPRVFGVFTHCDQFDQKKSKFVKMKKKMTERLQKVLSGGMKVFSMKSLHYGREYDDISVKKLARSLGDISWHSTVWKDNHGFVVANRIEDLTPEEDKLPEPLSERKVALYGWLRGDFMKPSDTVHIPGYGDITMDELAPIDDPLPNSQEGRGNIKAIFAPYSDTGGVTYDSDSIYVKINDKKLGADSAGKLTEGESMLKELRSLDLEREEVDIVEEFSEEDDQLLDLLELEDFDNELNGLSNAKLEDDFENIDELSDEEAVNFDKLSEDSVSESDDEADETPDFNATSLREKAIDMLRSRQSRFNIDAVVYGKSSQTKTSTKLSLFDDDEDDEDNKEYTYTHSMGSADEEDAFRYVPVNINFDDQAEFIMKRFAIQEEQTNLDENGLDTKVDLSKAIQDEVLAATEGLDRLKDELAMTELKNRRILDNLQDEDRIRVQGYSIGTYLRAIITLPKRFLDTYDPAQPVFFGVVHPNETQKNYVQSRIIRHNYYSKILKSTNPIFVSVGWRRFQTTAVYSAIDDTKIERYLKYTPRYLHCHLTYYGWSVAPQTGIVLFETLQNTPRFRIAAYGSVINFSGQSQVQKKLKLVGEPEQIGKTSAIIKNMFNTTAEVNRFLGAKIKTVSGIRGVIKKADRTPGQFRASFEAQIVKSDLVFMRNWYKVNIPNYCMNCCERVYPNLKYAMTLRDLRAARGVPMSWSVDSEYKDVERLNNPYFGELTVNKKFAEALPFTMKKKKIEATNAKSYLELRKVQADDKTRAAEKMVSNLESLAKDHSMRKAENAKLRQKEAAKEEERLAKKYAKARREKKKEYFRAHGKADAAARNKVSYM